MRQRVIERAELEASTERMRGKGRDGARWGRRYDQSERDQARAAKLSAERLTVELACITLGVECCACCPQTKCSKNLFAAGSEVQS